MNEYVLSRYDLIVLLLEFLSLMLTFLFFCIVCCISLGPQGLERERARTLWTSHILYACRIRRKRLRG